MSSDTQDAPAATGSSSRSGAAASGASAAHASRRSLYPLERSEKLQGCFLYWLPVFSQPLAWRERQWLMAFFDELHAFLTGTHKLRQEAFLQMKLIAPLGEPKELFHKHQMKLLPRMGLSRKPGVALPKIPTEADLMPVMKGKEKFVFDKYVGDYALWFLSREEQWRRSLFLGFGGYSMMYLLPDPKTVPPPLPQNKAFRANPVFSTMDVDGLWETTYLRSDRFCAQSKAVFGKGLEQEGGVAGVPFIIPLVNSAALHALEPAELEEWFGVFDVLIQESPEDNGILILSRHDLDLALPAIVTKLRTDKVMHPNLEDLPES